MMKEKCVVKVMKRVFFPLIMVVLVVTPCWGMSLREAIDIALKKSPILLQEKMRLKESREEKLASIRKNFGRLTLVGKYTHYNIPHTLSPIVPPVSPNITTSYDITSGGLMYEVLLFNGFSDLSSIKIARLGEELSRLRVGLSKQRLIFNIKSLYLKLLSLKAQKKAAISYRDALTELYKNVSQEVAVGKKAKIDLLKVSADLANASFVVKQIKGSITSLQSILGATIGVDKPVDAEEDTDPREVVTACANTDITHSYEYGISALKVKRAQEAIRKARSIYYPSLGVDVYVGDNYAKGDRKEIWQAEVTLKWLLFDFGVRKSEVRRSYIAKREAVISLRKTLLDLKSKIIEAREKIATAEKRLASLKEQERFLKEVREVERLKYEKGVSNMYDLLYAYARYQKAKSDYIGARYDLYIQRLYLNYLMAGER